MTILVGSTIPAYKAADKHLGESLAWLTNAREMIATTEREIGIDVEFFASLETDGRGSGPFNEIMERLMALAGSWMFFSIDKNEDEITSPSRMPRICAGRNFIQDKALSHIKYSHILFLDSDVEVPADSIVKLIALKHPLVGGHVPVYCLKGPVVKRPNVQEHWNTAGFLLTTREVFRHVRWGIDPDAGRTDDPQYAYMTAKLGFGKTWVDHDLIGKHRPDTPGPLPAMERRGHDRRIY